MEKADDATHAYLWAEKLTAEARKYYLLAAAQSDYPLLMLDLKHKAEQLKRMSEHARKRAEHLEYEAGLLDESIHFR